MNIACIKYGSKYKAEYVNRLYSMLARHAGFPFKFYCYTEKPEGIREEVNTRPLYYAFDPAWWDKVWLFQPPDELADDYLMTIDLDVVIIDSIGFLGEYKGDFCIADNAWPTDTSPYDGSLWIKKPGYGAHVWDNFCDNAFAIIHSYYSDQEWIANQLPGADSINQLWPGKYRSYKKDFHHANPQPGPPEDAAFYTFHGLPKPHEVTHIPWVKQNWR